MIGIKYHRSLAVKNCDFIPKVESSQYTYNTCITTMSDTKQRLVNSNLSIGDVFTHNDGSDYTCTKNEVTNDNSYSFAVCRFEAEKRKNKKG